MQANKRNLYFELLAQEGYRPFLDADNDIIFKVEGFSFVLFSYEADPAYFQLSLPNIWTFKPHEAGQILRAANNVSRDLKIVKAVVGHDRVWINAELLLVAQPDAAVVLRRTVESLLLARREFIEQVRQDGESLKSRHFGVH